MSRPNSEIIAGDQRGSGVYATVTSRIRPPVQQTCPCCGQHDLAHWALVRRRRHHHRQRVVLVGYLVHESQFNDVDPQLGVDHSVKRVCDVRYQVHITAFLVPIGWRLLCAGRSDHQSAPARLSPPAESTPPPMWMKRSDPANAPAAMT